MEAEDAAAAALAVGAEELGGVAALWLRRVGQERGVVVVEDVDAFVLRREVAAGARVAGAEVAGGVVVDVGESGGGVDLALPRARGAVRGDEHPLATEGIEAAMRVLERFGQTGSC
jgi:hypothetical protein